MAAEYFIQLYEEIIMARHRSLSLGVVTLAILVALAGCLGGGAPYKQSPPPEKVEQKHTTALRDAGSFIYNSHTSTDAAIIERSANVTAAVELDPSTRLVRVTESGDTSALYVPPNGQPYSREVDGDTVEYDRISNDSVRNVSRYMQPPLENLTRSYTFARNGTTTIGGQKTWVYRANASTLNESTAGPIAETVSELENVNTTITLYIRSNGLVKRVSYRASATVAGQSVSLTYRLTYTDVGSTDVTEPSWLDEAKSVAGS